MSFFVKSKEAEKNFILNANSKNVLLYTSYMDQTTHTHTNTLKTSESEESRFLFALKTLINLYYAYVAWLGWVGFGLVLFIRPFVLLARIPLSISVFRITT